MVSPVWGGWVLRVSGGSMEGNWKKGMEGKFKK